MAKRPEKNTVTGTPPEASLPPTPSPYARSRMRIVATHMVKEVQPVSNQQAFKTAGFGWFKLLFSLAAVVVDFVTNHNFISPRAVSPVSVALAILLMVSEFFLLYSYYAWREHRTQGRSPEAAKYLTLLVVCVVATAVDFVATVIPVRTLLLDGGAEPIIATFMGILAAAFTSIMQVDFYPTAISMVQSLLGSKDQ